MAETSTEEIEVVDSDKVYPLPKFNSDDGILSVPFTVLPGEGAIFRGQTSEGLIILTNYRLYHSEKTFFNIPLGLIDYIECKEIFYLFIYCKDGRTFRCVFDNNEDSLKWLKRLQNSIRLPEKIDDSFSFSFFSWTRNIQKENIVSLTQSSCHPKDSFVTITEEAERMGFDLKSVWKISRVNEDYQLCSSYPPYIIVPTSLQDDELKDLANFRYSRRIPAVVWRHQQNGCIIARSSQPRMGILSWRNLNDEKLIQAILDACISDPGYEVKINGKEESFSLKSDVDGEISIFYGQNKEEKPCQKKLLIIDARSYAAAMTNRAKGGGYECDGYYSNCEVQYMGLANIHAIRNSFMSLRTLCSSQDDINWLSNLETTKWLHHISGLLRAALLVVNAVDIERRPVLVHCSDGWDRTPQIVSLAELMLDPYYRTKKGFQVLVEREWLDFGHKFADRCGHPDANDDRNERCPVFLQWLDCVYQLLEQFQCHFEFNQQYLARLALHTYSCLFGTFLCNTNQARKVLSVSKRTFSVWPVLNEKSQFHNYIYNHSNQVLRPSFQIRSLKIWSDVYLPNNFSNVGKPAPAYVPEPIPEDTCPKTNLVKTKSCDNIPCVGHSPSLQRRNSDPSLLENSFSDKNYSQFSEADVKNMSKTSSTPNNRHIKGDTCLTNTAENDINMRTNTVSPSRLFLREPTIDGSTDTLVNEMGAINESNVNEANNSDDLCFGSKLFSSIGTSTTDLLLADVGVLQSVTQNINHVDRHLPIWCQSAIGAYVFNKRNSDSSNSCSCSYTTPNHSRTPSSGFPATPCDDPGDMPVLKSSATHQILDIDGLNIVPNAVQERIKKLILHYKNKVGSLQCELSSARSEIFHHLCRYYQTREVQNIDADDAPSLADSTCSGEQYASGGSDSSWDLLWSSEYGATNCVV
ncbi:LOW QUALITY PROTEIN: myotubularin-related protein 3-like [Uloborus diversus]|uniref:LOW QUALITY PROTEIN: myotubularin-related protein 3-like n=1 Tax=Uloborus diversus TaxID=327109 RepID=UPI002409424E|nr:LOW QUALITY PROTEIN: myotubularin-related protein 3-like [Uloborus diversus]